MMPTKTNVTNVGDVFGRLTVIGSETRAKPSAAYAAKGWLGHRIVPCRCECGKEVMARVNNLYSGNTSSCGCRRVESTSGPGPSKWHKPVVVYKAAHKRVRSMRGKAYLHPCNHCGNPADDWAYDHQDPNELMSLEGWPYSLDPDRYMPLCQSCHSTFDKKAVS